MNGPAVETMDESAPRTLFEKLNRLGGLLRPESQAVDRGDRAELRRMRPDGIPPEVYWRLTDGLGGDDAFWMTVMPLMIDFPHAPGVRPGRVLARAGVKPARVLRWLRRDRESAWREASRFLGPAKKGTALDWARLGTVMAGWDRPEPRRRFAREYFGELHKKQRQSTASTGEA